MTTLNLTQHTGTNEQGLSEPLDKDAVRALLNFVDLPTAEEVKDRAAKLAAMAVGHDKAMVGGAPFLMGPLVDALKAVGVQPVFAFSRRESSEVVQDDGSVRKVAVFRHLGFVDG